MQITTSLVYEKKYDMLFDMLLYLLLYHLFLNKYRYTNEK